MNRLAALGLLVLAIGLGAMVAPGLVPLQLDRALVYLVGFVALVQAYRVAGARRRQGIRRAETGDPEVPAATPVPGENLHDVIGDLTGSRGLYRKHGLREAAVAVLTRYAGFTEPEARAALADGSWTDDPFAAAHLGEDAPPIPVGAQLRQLFRPGSAHEFGRRRAIEAIAELADVAPADESAASAVRFVIGDGDRVEPRRVTDEPTRRETGHWRGVSAVALVAIGLGVVADVAPVVLAGVVGVGYAAYARASAPPAPDLEIERAVDETRPDAGDSVEVTLTVRNTGESVLPDLRVVDGVPGPLSIVEGSPRVGTALRPGEAATVSYAVEARRGVHEFEPVTVLSRDLAGTTEESRRVPVETTLRCVPTPRATTAPVPLRAAATQYTGRVRTSSGGEGVEFHATRAYQPGDPTNRIDWNRRARTGELATLEFREERAATVVVVVDARSRCYVANAPHDPHAVDRSVEAAARLVESLLSSGDRVGVAAFGADTWLPPGAGRTHRTRARELLATDPALSSTPPSGSPPAGWSRRLRRRLPSAAQVVVLSPLSDALSARLVRTFDASGHPASVVSPDPTVAVGEGPLLARVARRVRVTDLRGAGIPVVDWAPGESLDAALAKVAARRVP